MDIPESVRELYLQKSKIFLLLHRLINRAYGSKGFGWQYSFESRYDGSGNQNNKNSYKETTYQKAEEDNGENIERRESEDRKLSSINKRD